ncbi:MAG: thioredoxin fold domain-containing protein [Pseudobdellovibrionaceae bacterium]
MPRKVNQANISCQQIQGLDKTTSMSTLFFLSFMTVMISNFDMTSVAQADMKSAGSLTSAVKGKTFTARLKSGFHFNEKAPNHLSIDDMEIEPKKIEKNRIEFSFMKIEKQASQWGHASAQLYVCDDANTFCETHSVSLKPLLKNSAQQNTKAPVPVTETSDPKSKLNPEFDAALRKAEIENKIVILDFSARWCPGCVRFEKEVFPTQKFRELKKSVVFLKVDVDLFKNFQLAERFKLQGIPTIVALNANGEEINRMLDFKPFPELEKFIQTAKENPTTADGLIAAATQATDTYKLEIGKKLLAMNRYSASEMVFAQIKPEPSEIWTSRVELIKQKFEKDPTEKSAYIEILKQALDAEPEGTRSLAWRTELIPLLDEKSKLWSQIIAEGKSVLQILLTDDVKLKKAFMTDSAGEFVGFEKMLVAQLGIDLLDKAKASPSEIEALWNQAVSVSEAYQIAPDHAGPALRYLIFLSAAKKFDQAEKWADQLLSKDPQNLDILRRKMRILMGLNKVDDAIKLGEKIIAKSEGRNQFWVAESLAKAYLAAKKQIDAKKLLQAYLARSEMKVEKMKSTKDNFEKLLAESNGPPIKTAN